MNDNTDKQSNNNLLIENQFGFRSSTELAALYYSSHLSKQMDMGKLPLGITHPTPLTP